MRYIVVKREAIETTWRFETKTYDEAVDKVDEIMSEKNGHLSSATSDIENKSIDWKLYQEIGIAKEGV